MKISKLKAFLIILAVLAIVNPAIWKWEFE